MLPGSSGACRRWFNIVSYLRKDAFAWSTEIPAEARRSDFRESYAQRLIGAEVNLSSIVAISNFQNFAHGLQAGESRLLDLDRA
jgi:hypothetical protein